MARVHGEPATVRDTANTTVVVADQQSSAVHIAQMLERVARREAGPPPTVIGAGSFVQSSGVTSSASRTRRDADAPSETSFGALSSRRVALPRAQRRSRISARRDA